MKGDGVKLTGRNSYDEIADGLLAMMHQTIVIRLSSFAKNETTYDKSTFAGVMSSFKIMKARKSEFITIEVSLEDTGSTTPFTLPDFEIELVPTRSAATF